MFFEIVKGEKRFKVHSIRDKFPRDFSHNFKVNETKSLLMVPVGEMKKTIHAINSIYNET